MIVWMAPPCGIAMRQNGAAKQSIRGAPSMDQSITIGLDLAKSVFQVHGVDRAGAVVLRRQLRRAQVLAFFERLSPCLVGMEACSGAHHWARELGALGHEVRLMPPAYVKPYVKRGTTDAADAEAICAAVTRPTMRVTPQACLWHDAGQDGRATGGAARPRRTEGAPPAQGAGLSGPAADPDSEHDPRASGRVRYRRARGARPARWRKASKIWIA